MNLIIRAVVLSLVLPVIVSGQAQSPLLGTWEGAIAGETEAVPVAVELRIQGDVVTGPVYLHGTEQYLQGGKVIAGDTIEFTTARLMDTDRDVQYLWTGALAGDEITFSVIAVDRDGPARDFIVKRQVPQAR